MWCNRYRNTIQSVILKAIPLPLGRESLSRRNDVVSNKTWRSFIIDFFHELVLNKSVIFALDVQNSSRYNLEIIFTRKLDLFSDYHCLRIRIKKASKSCFIPGWSHCHTRLIMIAVGFSLIHPRMCVCVCVCASLTTIIIK